MERKCYTTKQYSRREFLKVSGFSASVTDNGLELKILEILEEIDVPIKLNFVEKYHCLPYRVLPKNVNIKLNRRKDLCRILLNKSKLKKLKPEPSVSFP